MKKSSCAAGYDRFDVHRASMALSNVYSSKNPKISGRDSGRTVKKKNAIMKDGIIMIMDKKKVQ